jgi:ceramide glucosyltransferase
MTAPILAALIFCVVALIVHVASIAVVLGRVRRVSSGTPYPDAAVSIIRPVCGVENFSEATLASAFHLTHPRYEILFCAAKAADPVIPLVSRLIAAHSEIPARLLIGNDHISTNPKLNNVVKGWAAAKHAWVVMADSNVLLPPDYLGRLFGKWKGDTGLVSSPAIGCSPDGIWGELECAFLNTYQARWQLFADSVGLGFAQGKTMMYRKELIQGAGGIRALAAELAEDAASTKLVRGLGLRVRVVDRPIPQPLGRRTASEVWHRQIRWARLRRDTFTVYFLPELLAGGVTPLAACAIVAAAHDLPVAGTLVAYAALWYAGEGILAVAAGWHTSWRSPLAWLLRDLLIPVLWLASWMRNDFVWRENSMRITNRRSAA